MISLRVQCTGRRPVHFFQKRAGVALGLLLAAAPLVSSPAAAAPAQVAGMGVGDFYTARKGAPLWFADSSGYPAQALVDLLKNAKVDGLDPDRYGIAVLEKAVADAAVNRKAVGRADAMLSQAFAAYVSDLRQQPDIGIIYVDPQLKPVMPSARAVLEKAAAAPSLESYVRTLGWMNPLYRELRQALVNQHYAGDHERELLELNLERARALPTGSKGRYVVVNAAEQRLYMWEDGKPIDSMVVVVGKPKNPTPLMAAYIRFAALNPYWYVPPDLATERIAPKVLKQGLKYLDELGYEVMSDWTPASPIIDPKTIDWKGVADGKVEVLMRQKPGPHNSMGRIKFMFPNQEGVYLHDNPERELFTEASRLYSGGCVRLEDAWRLSRWLFHRELTWEGAGTEEPVPLDPPVPVYITYLTAMPNGDSIAFFDDVYGRDKARLAERQSNAGTLATAAK